jgi:hypothetical protein
LNSQFSKEVQMANKYSKKSNILGYKGKASQNDIEIPFHPSQNNYHQENKQEMLSRMQGQREHFILLKCTLVHPLWKSV